jgi:hypothetical protein
MYSYTTSTRRHSYTMYSHTISIRRSVEPALYE